MTKLTDEKLELTLGLINELKGEVISIKLRNHIQAQAYDIKVLREALDNLENDAGTIPANLWKMVTDARGRK